MEVAKSNNLLFLILLFGLYVQFHGDFTAGGGFQAGVIFAAGFILYNIIFGIKVGQSILSINMTKKLESLFDLPDVKDHVDYSANGTDVEPVAQDIPELKQTLESVDKIDEALPTIRDLETSDKELDEIADTAKETFQDLMDLGMNVEARFAGEIFNNASKMLDTALTAKSNKLNKKLKMVDLQLKKANLDLKKNNQNYDHATDGSGVVLDRNTLLQEILGKNV